MRKILCFLCAILVACNATITASATSRIVENLDDDFLVRERITLTGEKIPARDFVLLINLRDIEDIDFFSQLYELEKEMHGQRFAVVLMGNSAYALKSFSESMSATEANLLAIKDMMALLFDAQKGEFNSEHLENALRYEMESNKANLRVKLREYVEERAVDLVSINAFGSCLSEYRELCELGYFSNYINLHEGFMKARELAGDLPIVFYGSIETAWYTGEVLLESGEVSGQRGNMEGMKRRPGLYNDADFILDNGGVVAFNEFVENYAGDDELSDFFERYSIEIEASTENSARLINLWSASTALRRNYARASDVASGNYKYTNMERAVYFAYKEIAAMDNEVYYLRRERVPVATTMARLFGDFDD